MAGERILIVENNSLLVEHLSGLLLNAGYVVTAATEGESAAEIAEEWKPDVIVLDMQMPDLNCTSFAAQVRQSMPVPIIMISDHDPVGDKARAFHAGADAFLPKPIDAAHLHGAVAQILSGKEQRQRGRLITVFSLRGGSGVTSLAVNLAAGLSMMWSQSAVLVDLALPVGACDIMLDLKPQMHLGHLAEQSFATMDEVIIKNHLTSHPASGATLLGGITDPVQAEHVTEELSSFVLGHLRHDFPYVVVDTSHEFSGSVLPALEYADEIILPMTPDIGAARSTVSALRLFDRIGINRNKVRLILNASHGAQGLTAEQIEKSLNLKIDRTIPHDDDWIAALNQGQPIILTDPDPAKVSELEALIWDVSSPADQAREMDQPTEMWKRARQPVKKGLFGLGG